MKKDGYWIKCVDLKYPEISHTQADDFVIGDLRDPQICRMVTDRSFDEVYQLAADMGGAGFVFTGDNDADIMHNSALINLNMLEACYKRNVKKIFYSSSACMYPEYNQQDPDNPKCAEDSAYPAAPDSEYGWEKLFSERLYLAFHRNYGMDVRIARFNNIFEPESKAFYKMRTRVQPKGEQTGTKGEKKAEISMVSPEFATINTTIREQRENKCLKLLQKKRIDF